MTVAHDDFASPGNVAGWGVVVERVSITPKNNILNIKEF